MLIAWKASHNGQKWSRSFIQVEIYFLTSIFLIPCREFYFEVQIFFFLTSRVFAQVEIFFVCVEILMQVEIFLNVQIFDLMPRISFKDRDFRFFQLGNPD